MNQTGTVLWYHSAPSKRFGLIRPDDNSPDVFVHYTAVDDSSDLVDGEQVEFTILAGPKGPQAVQVKRCAQ